MIPVFEPEISEHDIAAVVAALRRGEISGTFGESIPGFEAEFASFCGCRYGIAVSSGTAALHLAVAAAGIGRGDEVLVSASTNVASALAVYHNEAITVPVDSEPNTWNLDLDLVESLITPRTRAMIAVHLYGHPVDMDRLCAIAERHNLLVIEDCAESHGAACRGRLTGSFGRMSCFSFYANKILTCGEGGMILTDDAGLAERLRLLRNLAFTKPRFLHAEAGYNFRMTGFQAALGRSQLARIDNILAERRRVALTYNELLNSVPGLQIPLEAPWARHAYWMYALAVQPEFGISRDELAASLGRAGIETRTFFCPMNQQPCLRRHGRLRDVPCPVADRLWETGLYLPSSPTLDFATIAGVCDHISGARSARARAA